MMPASLRSTAASLTPGPAGSSSSSGPPSLGGAPGTEESPDTPQEAAQKFEEVLVRQFTKVMTDDMFSGSLAGEGGGKWMESQRDRQRDWMTDLITEQLVEANTLGISETLAQEWGAAGPNADPEAPSRDAQEEVPAAPTDADEASRPIIDTPPDTPDKSHIDHAV